MDTKNEKFLEKIMMGLIPNWERYEKALNWAKENGDEDEYKQARIKLGTLKLSTGWIINSYKEVYGEIPMSLKMEVDNLSDKCRKY